MDHLTIREAYGHGLPLGIDAQIPQQILDLVPPALAAAQARL